MNRIILVFLIIINSVFAQGSLRGINSELDRLKKELQTDLVEQVDTVQGRDIHYKYQPFI